MLAQLHRQHLRRGEVRANDAPEAVDGGGVEPVVAQLGGGHAAPSQVLAGGDCGPPENDLADAPLPQPSEALLHSEQRLTRLAEADDDADIVGAEHLHVALLVLIARLEAPPLECVPAPVEDTGRARRHRAASVAADRRPEAVGAFGAT